MKFLEDEMVEGYCDGRNPVSPEPSGNRTHSYRHGFLAGRNDLNPRYLAHELRKMADEAMRKDIN